MGVLRSMTGYGEAVTENESFKVKAAAKAVNQRYLDITLHAPVQLAPFEVKLRQAVKARVARGKLDRFRTLTDKREGSTSVRCNRQLASAYQQALNELSDYLHVARPDDVQEIYELRLALELWALERSIARITDEELDALQAAFEEGYRTGAWETLHNADRGLHDLITEKAWSRRLLMLLSLLNTQAERIRYQSARSLGRDDLSYREHLHIIQCIRERDLEKSRVALRTHLRSVANSAMDAAKAQAVKSSL